MKITAVTPFVVDPGYGKNWLFVKVETSDGLHGWGECYTQADRDQSIVAHVKQLGRYLAGRDASHIRHFTHWAYHDFAAKRGAMDFWSAVSGLEQALWDLAGKRLGVPVVTLLGGPCRERIRVYANGWYSGAKTPAAYAAKAKETVARGFTALKFDPFPGPWRTHISREAEEQVVETVRAVREAVGPKVDLLIEVHRRLAPMHAVRVARMLEPFDPFWYEEPVSARDIGALAECRREIRPPIVTGEELYTRFEFREVFERRAADIINPDVCNVGGIEELRADRRHGRGVPRGRLAPQLQQHHRGPRRHAARVGGHPELPDHGVLRELRAPRRGDRREPVPRGAGLCDRAHRARARHRASRGRAGALRLPRVPRAQRSDPARRGAVDSVGWPAWLHGRAGHRGAQLPLVRRQSRICAVCSR